MPLPGFRLCINSSDYERAYWRVNKVQQVILPPSRMSVHHAGSTVNLGSMEKKIHSIRYLAVCALTAVISMRMPSHNRKDLRERGMDLPVIPRSRSTLSLSKTCLFNPPSLLIVPVS